MLLCNYIYVASKIKMAFTQKSVGLASSFGEGIFYLEFSSLLLRKFLVYVLCSRQPRPAGETHLSSAYSPYLFTHTCSIWSGFYLLGGGGEAFYLNH